MTASIREYIKTATSLQIGGAEEESYSFGEDLSATGGGQGFRITTDSRRRTSREHRAKKVLRRFEGTLLSIDEGEARVLLFDREKRYEYILPADQLRKANIHIEHQPFEMDEVELVEEDGTYIVGYQYRPAATCDDAFLDTLRLDDSRSEKLKSILRATK